MQWWPDDIRELEPRGLRLHYLRKTAAGLMS